MRFDTGMLANVMRSLLTDAAVAVRNAAIECLPELGAASAHVTVIVREMAESSDYKIRKTAVAAAIA
jgi:uncharacterized protein (DUF2336 family)